MKYSSRTWREKWRLWRLGAVERCYFELKENNTYPFEDLGDGFYYIAVRSDKFMFGVGLIISTVCCFILFCVLVDFFSFPLGLFLVFLAYGMFSMYGHLSTKELIISRNGGYLMRIKGGNRTLVEEPVHNCYIKLQRKYDSNRQPHFYLILGGYRLDDIRISGMGNQDVALRLLGIRLAARMGVNYFDYENNSTMHKIIHYPSFSTLRANPEEYARFLAEHWLAEEDVAHATGVDRLAYDTNIAPASIVELIKGNYKARAAKKEEELVQIMRPTLSRLTPSVDPQSIPTTRSDVRQPSVSSTESGISQSSVPKTRPDVAQPSVSATASDMSQPTTQPSATESNVSQVANPEPTQPAAQPTKFKRRHKLESEHIVTIRRTKQLLEVMKADRKAYQQRKDGGGREGSPK